LLRNAAVQIPLGMGVAKTVKERIPVIPRQ